MVSVPERRDAVADLGDGGGALLMVGGGGAGRLHGLWRFFLGLGLMGVSCLVLSGVGQPGRRFVFKVWVFRSLRRTAFWVLTRKSRWCTYNSAAYMLIETCTH